MRRRASTLGPFEPIPAVVCLLATVGWALPGFPVAEAGGASVGPTERVSSTALALSLRATPNGTDTGAPVLLTATATGGEPPYGIAWTDSLGDSATGPAWELSPAEAGALVVTANVTDAWGEVAGALLTVAVAAPPTLALSPAPVSWAPDGTVVVGGTVEGGTPPFQLSLHLSGDAAGFSVGLARTGDFSVSAMAGSGKVDVSGVLTDAVADSASDAVTLLPIPIPPLQLNVGPPLVRADAGTAVHLLFRVSGAIAPVTYAVAAAAPLANTTAVGGPVNASGTVLWAGTWTDPGAVDLWVSVKDGAGRTAAANLTVEVTRPLDAFLVGGPGGVAAATVPLLLVATVAGGAPPYAWVLSGSDGEAATGNLSGPGSFNLSLSPSDSGPFLATLQVTDANGVVVRALDSVSLAASAAPLPPTPTGSPDPVGLGVAAATGLFAVGYVGYRRFRPRPAGTASPGRADPGDSSTRVTREVRRLLRDSTGMDRDSLALLATEAGLAAPEVATAVERWRRAGRIEVGPGTGGAERLRWVEPERSADDLEGEP